MANTKVTTNVIADNAITLDKMAGIARGKIIYGDSSGNPAVLTVGSAGTVLTSDGTDISWAEEVATNYLPLAGGTMTGNIAHAGNFTLDIGGDIILDADGGQTRLRDGGTEWLVLSNESAVVQIYSPVSNSDIQFVGNDGGSTVTALTLDMSDAGTATFNHDVNITGTTIASENIRIRGGASTPISGEARLGGHTSWGAQIYGYGGTNDISLVNRAGTVAMAVLANTTNITMAGNVGIGTTAPASLLHIESSTAWGAQLMINQDDAGTTGAQLFLKHTSSSPADDDYIGFINFKGENSADQEVQYARIHAESADVTDGTEDGSLFFNTAVAGTENTSVMSMVGGKVGIGVTSPTAKLQVSAANANTEHVVITGSGNPDRGLSISTQKSNYPTDSGQHDAAVVYNAQDTEASSVYGQHIFQTGGTTRMQIDSVGVGIGTATPSELLHVQGDGADILITDAGGGEMAKLGATGSNNGLLELKNSSHAAKVFLNTSGDSYLTGGNVGIGTTNPAYHLVVDNQAGNDAAYIQILTDNDQSGYLLFGDGDHNYPGGVAYNHNLHKMRFSVGSDDIAMTILGHASDNSTKVGIGTDSPSAMLHLYKATGSGALEPELIIENNHNTSSTTDGAGRLTFYSDDTSNSGIPDNAWLGQVRFMGDDKDGSATEFEYAYMVGLARDPGSGTSRKGGLSFYTRDGNSMSETMVITEDKVGIGTASPTYTLDVAGDIGVNEYIYHNDDTNTYLRFLTDRFQIRTDGDDRIDVQSNGLTKFTPDVQIGIKQRNVSTWQTEFLIYGSTSTNWDMTAYDEGGAGNSFLVIATWAHYAADSHSLALVALVHTRGTDIHQHTILNHTHSNNGSFTISKASNSTLRITKNAGTYGGSGRGFISVTSYNNT